MTWQRAVYRGVALSALVLSLCSTALPAHGHGELHLRIAAVSATMQQGTNNLAELHLKRGELYREDGDWKAAESDYEEAARLGAKLEIVDRCRAMLLRDSGKFEEARILFDEVLRRNERDAEAWIGSGRLHAKVHEFKSAAADFRRGLQCMDAPEHGLFLELAQALDADNAPTEAVAELDRGIKKLGPLPPLQRYALELDLKLENYDSGLVRINTLIDLATRKEELLAQRGEILLRLGRKSEARQSFHAALVAIDALPKRIREGAAILALQSKVQSAMTETIAAANEISN